MSKRRTNNDILLNILSNLNEFKEETNSRFLSIDKRFETIDKRFKVIDKELKNIGNYIKRDASISEMEMNETVRMHLEKVFQGYFIIKYDDQLKTIRDPYDPSILLTDFDGLLLLKSKNEKQFPNAERILVIIEAKHYISLEKVEQKLMQKHKLKDFIKISKDINELKNTSKKFQETVKTHKLDKVSEVYLYLGAPFWDSKAKELAETEYKKELKANLKSTIGILSLTGDRYNIKDFATLAKGGKK